MKRMLIALLALALLAAQPVLAQSIVAPGFKFDLEQLCRGEVEKLTSGAPGTLDHHTYSRGCLLREQRLVEELERLLSTLPRGEALERCGRQTEPQRMLWCVGRFKAERDAAATRMSILDRLPSAGEALPRFDVDRMCRSEMRARAVVTEADLRGCLDREQIDYDALKPIWPRLPRVIAVACAWLFKEPLPTYRFIRSCVEDELDKAAKAAALDKRERELPAVRFRY